MEKYILLKFYILFLIFGFDGSEFACFNQSCVELLCMKKWLILKWLSKNIHFISNKVFKCVSFVLFCFILCVQY